jgi:hypothetical protein
MSTALASNENDMHTSPHSKRLAQLRAAAAEIRRRHARGEITAYEAAQMLDALAKQNITFFDKLLT